MEIADWQEMLSTEATEGIWGMPMNRRPLTASYMMMMVMMNFDYKTKIRMFTLTTTHHS